ncbi:MAG TPA: RNA-binding protein [Desulfobulbaceae bacterium]|nr:RNA-binding protein [Desulfobulbaceae bacterium]
MKLFIGNLPYAFSETELTTMFTTYGNVVSAKLVTDHFSGEAKGFGFVEMGSRSEGHKAMENLNGKEYKHRQLVCNEAKENKKRGHRR